MSREKAQFEYVADDQKRKLSFNKRQRGIKKKAKELSVLCGVDVVVIAYNDLSDPHSEVWANDGGVHGFLDKYHGMPVLENTLKQEELIQKRLHKMHEYLKKKSNENFEEEISQLMINYMGGYADPTVVSENALHLKMLVEQHLKEIDRVMEESGKEEGEVFVPVAPPMSEEGSLMNGVKMPPRRRTLRSVASDGENSDEASTQPADQHVRGRGRGQGVRGRGRGRRARLRGGRASQTTRESIPAKTENRHPPRRSALEAAVVTPEVTPNQPEPSVQPVQDEEDGSFSKKRKWGNEGKSLVQDGSTRGSKLQNRAHTLPEAPTSSTKSAASVTRSKSEARGILKLASSVDKWVI
ncbi:agamous-like MADS-box protein AGL80 [Senna tora]|uniref:Agamous-like MADS-box protein AGL80 n=1 Tax=Senna tora TaxID=362788 RepID=A0A834TGB6_9FABA|nr:agamous-like MADS-box protein AGL80 [Senna tora]